MKTVLLTLGRLPKGLDVARSFAAFGWRVIVADPFRDHLLGASRAVAKSFRVPSPALGADAYLDALLDIIAEERVELVVPVSEEIMYVSLLRERAPADVRVFAMPSAALHAAHDKFAFALKAASLGLSVPRTALASEAFAEEIAGDDDFVVKERHSCGGGGVSFFARGAVFPRSEDALVQARARGDEYSSCSLAHEGRVLGTSIYRAAVTSGTVAVRFERVDREAIDHWIERFVAETAWTGFISFDFIMEAGCAPLALECNPRLTSGVHFFETSDIARAIVDPSAPLRRRPERLLQQFWSCLQEAQHALPNLLRFVQGVAEILRTRDVTWSFADPAPLLTMPWTSREILREASRANLSLAVAATRDLSWIPAATNAGVKR